MPSPPTVRGPMRRFLEARGVVGRIASAHVTARFVAADGVPLVGSYLPGPGPVRPAVLLVHGFAANRRKPAYARLAAALGTRASVLTIDLRGHGDSGGACTLGDSEHLDIEAALTWLRGFGHDRIVAVGVSMGATAVLHAVSGGERLAGVATVSAPAWFRDPPDTAPLRRLHDVWTSPTRRRALLVALGVRLAGPDAWSSPPHPVEMLAGVSVPYLAVHGHDDPYFPATDGLALVAAAAGPAIGWLEPTGFGHAEDGFAHPFNRRLAHAVLAADAVGRFPSRGVSLSVPSAAT